MSEENNNPENKDLGEKDTSDKDTQSKPNEYEQLVAAYKEKLSKANSELEQIKKQLEDDKKKGLQDNNNYKELHEMTSKELEEWKEKFNNLQEYHVTDKRNSAIKDAARKAGIRDDALRDLDLLDHQVELETTSQGNINVIGLDNYINNLKAQRPHWFGDSIPPKGNFGNGGKVTSEKKLSASEIVEMQKKDPEKYKEYMQKTYFKK